MTGRWQTLHRQALSIAPTTGIVLGWNVARLSAQLLWVVLLAHVLGPEGYGEYSGLAGLAFALAGLAGLGLGLRLYQDVARDHNLLAVRWSQAKRTLGWSSPVLAAIFAAVIALLFPELPGLLVFAVASAELILAPVITQIAFAYAAVGRMASAAFAPVVLALGRILAAAAFLAFDSPGDLVGYSLAHLVATGGAVAVAAYMYYRAMPFSTVPSKVGWEELRVGFGFASVWASGMALGSLDKTFVLRIGGATIAGEYSAGYRFATLAALPVEVLTTIIMPRVFRAGSGQPLSWRIVVMLGLSVTGYGFAAGVAVASGGAIIPSLLGSGFEGAVAAVALLGWWVPAYGLRLLAANLLLGLERKRQRVLVEMGGLVALTVLLAAMVPQQGLAGAVMALVIAEWLIVAAGWGFVIQAVRAGLGKSA